MTPVATTWLFVPGTAPARFNKAAAAGADAVILDLEDAVHPEHKVPAREAVVGWLTSGGRAWVRVNAADTPWHTADLAAIAALPGLVGVVLPKAADPSHVRRLARTLGQGRYVAALIESALGVHRATDLAGAGAARLMFGSLDFGVDVGCDHSRDALLAARSALVMASRVHGLPGPVDGVTSEVQDTALVAEAATYARSLGFTGKLCIHPGQITPVAAAFVFTAEEREWAHGVIAAFEGSTGVVTGPDGRMIDQPVVDRAHAILRS